MCEATFIHAVVDSVVDPFVHIINLFPEIFRQEASTWFVGFAEVRLEKGVEGGIEHSDDLGGLVVDNGVELFVPQYWHCVASNVVWVGLEVELLEGCEAVERVCSV